MSVSAKEMDKAIMQQLSTAQEQVAGQLSKAYRGLHVYPDVSEKVQDKRFIVVLYFTLHESCYH